MSEASRLTQAERRSRSEDALLDAAAEVIAERGVDGASLASIGEAAGVSRGLANHHFGSKDSLIDRLAQRAQDRILTGLDVAVELRRTNEGTISGLAFLELTVDAYLEMFQHPTDDQRALIVMWGSTFPARSSVGGMVEAERRSYEGLANLVSFGQEDGSIRSDVDPEAVAVTIFGLMRGLAALFLTDSSLVEMGRVRQTCRDVIMSSLRAESGAA